MTRLLGIDLGERRIGLAIADRDGGGAMALTTLRRVTPEIDGDAIRRLATEHDVDELVVGLPLHASGAAGDQVEKTLLWVSSIRPLVGLPIALRDERLTSHLAEERLGPMKRGRSGGPPTRSQRDAYRARVDREAAAIILQDEIDARTNRSGGAAGDTDMERSR